MSAVFLYVPLASLALTGLTVMNAAAKAIGLRGSRAP